MLGSSLNILVVDPHYLSYLGGSIDRSSNHRAERSIGRSRIESSFSTYFEVNGS